MKTFSFLNKISDLVVHCTYKDSSPQELEIMTLNWRRKKYICTFDSVFHKEYMKIITLFNHIDKYIIHQFLLVCFKFIYSIMFF